MIRGGISRSSFTTLLAPADLAHTNTKSKVFDMQGFKQALFLINAGVLTGGDANNYATITLQDSDDFVDANFADIAAADYEGGVAPGKAVASSPVACSYIGNKRYVRVAITYTGVGITAGIIGVTAIGQRADYLPATAPAPITAT